MYALSQIHLLLGAISCLIGVGVCFVGRDRSIVSRLALLLLPPIAFVVIWNWYFTLVFKPSYPFLSAARLVPSVALRYGYALYYPGDRGPVNGWVYPPAAVFAYLPATLVSDPPMTVLVGCCLSLLFYFGPVIGLLVNEVRRGRLNAEVACLLFMVFAVLSNSLIGLKMVATTVHTDAPALGFGALALGLVGRIRGGRLGTIGFGAVLAAICASLTKQVQVPLLVMPALWVTATGGMRRGLRSLGITAALALCVLIPIALVFGPRQFVFNTWIVPSNHGLKGLNITENATLVLRSLSIQIQRPVLACLVYLVASIAFVRVRCVNGLGALRDDPVWLPFLIGGCLEMPSAILGYVKRGGDFNGEAYALYPLAIALILFLGRCVWSVRPLAVPLILLTLYLGLSESRGARKQLAELDPVSSGQTSTSSKWIAEERLVLRYLREHPGEAYFPYNILDHLVVEKHLYHFELGVDFQTLPGYPLSLEHLREFVPARTRIICYPPDVIKLITEPTMPRYLGSFSEPVSIPDLPGFSCFTQSAAAGQVATERNAVGPRKSVPSGATNPRARQRQVGSDQRRPGPRGLERDLADER